MIRSIRALVACNLLVMMSDTMQIDDDEEDGAGHGPGVAASVAPMAAAHAAGGLTADEMLMLRNLMARAGIQGTTPEPAPAATQTRGVNRDDWVRIMLEDSEAIPPTGQPFGYNGQTYILRSGEEALVPPAIISILNDAVMDVPVTDAASKKIIGYRKRLRFPYHRVT